MVSVPSCSIIQLSEMFPGKVLYVPRIIREPSPDSKVQTSHMQFYRMHDKEDYEKNLIPGVWGIREPGPLSGETLRSTGERFLNDRALLTFKVFDQGSQGLDLILMPGLDVHACYPVINSVIGMAFDHDMARLGHGKGYYDHFIAKYRSHASTNGWSKSTLGQRSMVVGILVTKLCFSVALALSEQIVDVGVIPMAEYDARLDSLVTKDGLQTKS